MAYGTSDLSEKECENECGGKDHCEREKDGKSYWVESDEELRESMRAFMGA